MDEVPDKPPQDKDTLFSADPVGSADVPSPGDPTERTDTSLVPIEAPATIAHVAQPVPTQLAEFELREKLGQGGFGCVYAGFDTILHREVAIKIPHRTHANHSGGVDQYLHEARAIAALDHPNILPVYQAATSDEVPLFIVTKWIDGTDLGKWAAINRPSFVRIASMIERVAEALAYAHARNIIHRDIKPANILVDRNEKPFLADFGLALTETDFHDGPAFIGTVPYMSPEQARGEGHRVDGRSDIFSLGIVLYQLLVGRRPFEGIDRRATLLAIRTSEPEHPRRLNPAIPKELARICLRALAKHKTDRYATADAFACDLKDYLKREEGSATVSLGSSDQTSDEGASELSFDQSRGLIPVVPKGLRSFETNDADFFLRLLPGPYDRHGVPEKIRFWKTKLESRQPQQACSVGVIYGPSGCGKTSLFRAGLLPLLSQDIIVICIEATPHNTESLILEALKQTLDLPPQVASEIQASSFDRELVALLAWVRRHYSRKVVLCIDQFEQWLLAHSATVEHAELTEALRQCDGVHLQSLLLVRDDFWMGITRLMQALEQDISELHNASCVDLFDQRHARKVLALFGHAYGKLPAEEEQLSTRENRFLDAAIDYLSTDGRVICVQLALLAEMMKHRAWNESDLLSKDGGAGIGVRFLEQVFDSESSLRRYRRHADGTQKILRLLLPELGVRIKGTIRSQHELFEACGYSDLASFRELLRILDAELHLITPTDRRDDESMSGHALGGPLALQETGYQLTHDFLIAPVRRWLELRQLGTRVGQAQVRLEEYTDLYRARPSSHSLPTLFDYFMIRSRLDPNTWNEPQLRMMNAARGFYFKKGARWALITSLMFIAVLGSWNGLSRHQAWRLSQANVDALLVATLSGAIDRADKLRDSDYSTRELVRSKMKQSTLGMSERLRAALVSAHEDPEARQLIWQGMQEMSPDEVVMLARRIPINALVPVEDLQKAWKSGEGTPFQQLCSACLFAHDSKLRDQLVEDIPRLVPHLLNENPMLVSDWMNGLKPVSEPLLSELVGSFERLLEQSNTTVVNASNLIAQYAADQPEQLADVIGRSNETAFPLFVPALRNHPRGLEALRAQMARFSAIEESQEWQPDFRGIDWWNAPSAGAALPAYLVATSASDTNRDVAVARTSTLDLKELARIANEPVIGNAHFVLCHALETKLLDRVSEHLAHHGFRVANVRPLGPADPNHIMVLFKCDGRSSVWTLASTDEELKLLHERHRQTGYYAEDVAAYSLDGEKTFVYVATWTDQPPLPTVVESDMYIHVHAPEHKTKGWQRFNDRGFVPRSNVLTMDRQGEEHFTSVRWRLEESVQYNDQWNESKSWTSSVMQWSPDTLLLQQRLGARPPDQAERRMTVIAWSGVPMESKWIEYGSIDKHRQASQDLIEAGYRPVDIHVTQIAGWSEPGYSSTWWRPLPDYAQRSRRIAAQARLIVAAHALGDHDPLLDSLASTSDAELRASVIDAFSRYQIPQDWLLEQLAASKVLAIRRACALALGLYPKHTQSEGAKSRITQILHEAPSAIADPGLRSSLDALCIAWGLEKIDWTAHPSRQEIKTRLGQRMIIVDPPSPVWLGSPGNEPGRDSTQEHQYAAQIKNRYAIASHEITVENYAQYRASANYAKDYSPSPDCPMIMITWFDAVRFCRWLSDEEDIPESEMCYPPLDQIGPDMTLHSDYLERTGYRLPTDAEWEYASRGGYAEARHFGFAPQLLNQYAWTAQNSGFRCHPIGTRLPNDFGLFDMMGNAMEWCSDRWAGSPWPLTAVTEDTAGNVKAVAARDRMSTRGGAVLFQPLDARSAHRNDHPATENRVYLSFRIAKTIRPAE